MESNETSSGMYYTEAEQADRTTIVCAVIPGGRVRITATRRPSIYLKMQRDRGFLCLPVSVFPTFRSRFEREAELHELPAEPLLAYTARWLFRAPIVSAYQLPVYRYLDWVKKTDRVLFDSLWASYRDAAPRTLVDSVLNG